MLQVLHSSCPPDLWRATAPASAPLPCSISMQQGSNI